MTSPLAEYDAQIDALRAQMEPLQERLRSVVADRHAYADLLSEETDDPKVLVALREASQIAHKKLSAHVRATTHAGIWDFTDWLPISDDYSTGYALGPSLSLDKGADKQYVTDLAASMMDFVDRFGPAPALVIWDDAFAYDPTLDRCGMVFAPITSPDPEDSAYTSYAIWYTPDGSRAFLFNHFDYHSDIPQGTLVEMLTLAVKVAHNSR
jgi:hypothetical protein